MKKSPFETCFGYLPKTQMELSFGKDAVDGHHEADKALRFIQRIQAVQEAVQEQLEKSWVKYKARHDKHRVDHQFQVGDRFWLHITKERMKGEGKKLKPIWYGPFEILEKIGTNDFHLNLLHTCTFIQLSMLRILNYMNLL